MFDITKFKNQVRDLKLQPEIVGNPDMVKAVEFMHKSCDLIQPGQAKPEKLRGLKNIDEKVAFICDSKQDEYLPAIIDMHSKNPEFQSYLNDFVHGLARIKAVSVLEIKQMAEDVIVILQPIYQGLKKKAG